MKKLRQEDDVKQTPNYGNTLCYRSTLYTAIPSHGHERTPEERGSSASRRRGGFRSSSLPHRSSCPRLRQAMFRAQPDSEENKNNLYYILSQVVAYFINIH